MGGDDLLKFKSACRKKGDHIDKSDDVNFTGETLNSHVTKHILRDFRCHVLCGNFNLYVNKNVQFRCDMQTTQCVFLSINI